MKWTCGAYRYTQHGRSRRARELARARAQLCVRCCCSSSAQNASLAQPAVQQLHCSGSSACDVTPVAMMRWAAALVCVVLLSKGPGGCEGQQAAGCEADVTADGRVNVADILATLSAFGGRYVVDVSPSTSRTVSRSVWKSPQSVPAYSSVCLPVCLSASQPLWPTVSLWTPFVCPTREDVACLRIVSCRSPCHRFSHLGSLVVTGMCTACGFLLAIQPIPGI